MLENNLENAERPEELIVYAGSAKAARDWESFDRIVEALKTMEEEQTLVVQSGKPIGLFTTHRALADRGDRERQRRRPLGNRRAGRS